MSDESKQASPQQPKEKIDDLSQKPISDRDAQSVKGGRAAIDGVKGESAKK
jgi:hypothetical protein